MWVSGPCRGGERRGRERGEGDGVGTRREETAAHARFAGVRVRAGQVPAPRARTPHRRGASFELKTEQVAWRTETAGLCRASRAAAQRPLAGAPSEGGARLSLSQRSVSC